MRACVRACVRMCVCACVRVCVCVACVCLFFRIILYVNVSVGLCSTRVQNIMFKLICIM